jgi:hypothetical protein
MKTNSVYAHDKKIKKVIRAPTLKSYALKKYG